MSGKTPASVHYETYFWDAGHPADVKFAIEKATRMLLARDAGEGATLVFRGTSASRDPTYRARFCFEAAMPEINLYSLHLDASGAGNWFTEEKVRLYSDRVWEHWIRGLELTPAPLSREGFSPVLYRQLVAETLMQEQAEAERKEAPAPIAALQQEILAAIRGGRKCGSSNKEGNTTFFFDGARFVRGHIGDYEEKQVFASDAEMLAQLRRHYDWDTKRQTYPHPPPEVEVWRFIRSKLY